MLIMILLFAGSGASTESGTKSQNIWKENRFGANIVLVLMWSGSMGFNINSLECKLGFNCPLSKRRSEK